MSSNDLFRKTLMQVRDLLKHKKISPEELLSVCQHRMRETSALNYFIRAVEQKDPLINSKIDLPLKGIPFSVKDNFYTEDMPTTCASLMLENHIPEFNATVVEKLHAYGGSMMGKDNMDQFAMGSGGCESEFGPVRNPWNFDKLQAERSDDFYIAGGSSGGSAAAVAAGATFFSIGSDTGGSVRVPAAFCGVVGLKPTYGALSRHGLIPLCNSLDVPGIFTRSVADSAFVFNILKGRDVNDPTTIKQEIPNTRVKPEENVKGMIIGIPKEHYVEGTHPDIRAAWDKAIKQFTDGGATVIEVSLPNQEYVQPCYRVLCCSDVAVNLAKFDEFQYGRRARQGDFTDELNTFSRDYGFNETVKRRITAGNYFLMEENKERFINKALSLRRMIRGDYAKAFGAKDSKSFWCQRQVSPFGSTSGPLPCDLLLTPTTSVTSPLHSSFTAMADLDGTEGQDHKDLVGMPEVDYHVTGVNIAGVPAISVPVGLSTNQHGHEMPIGLHLVAWEQQENKLFRAAKFLEQESNFQQWVENN